jgi:hypothetical protein
LSPPPIIQTIDFLFALIESRGNEYQGRAALDTPYADCVSVHDKARGTEQTARTPDKCAQSLLWPVVDLCD